MLEKTNRTDLELTNIRRKIIKELWNNMSKFFIRIINLMKHNSNCIYLSKSYIANSQIPLKIIDTGINRNVIFRYITFSIYKYKKYLINIKMQIIQLESLKQSLKETAQKINYQNNDQVNLNIIMKILSKEKEISEKYQKYKLLEHKTYIILEKLIFSKLVVINSFNKNLKDTLIMPTDYKLKGNIITINNNI